MFGIKIKFEKKPKIHKEEAKEEKKETMVSDIKSSFANNQTPIVLKGKGLGAENEDFGAAQDRPFDVTQDKPSTGWVWQVISKTCLYALIFLTPLFFLPWGVSPVASNKQFMVILLVAIALISWLAKTIASGKLVWPRTPLNIAAWILVLVWGVSAYFSVSPSKSFGFMGAEPDNFLNVLTYVLAFFLVGAVFNDPTPTLPLSRGERGRGGIQNAIFVFLASLTILAIFTGLKFLNVNILPHSATWEFAKTVDFNPIGTINALGLFLSFGLVLIVSILVTGGISLGLMEKKEGGDETAEENGSQDLSWKSKTTHSASSAQGFGVQKLSEDAGLPAQYLEGAPRARFVPPFFHPTGGRPKGDKEGRGGIFAKSLRIGLVLLTLILGAELLLINFRGAWWALAGAMLFLVAFALTREVQDIKAGRKEIIKTQKLVLPIVILAISVILLLVSLPIGNLIAFPAEVGPSNSATYNIAKDVWKAKGGSAEIGSGPATFSYDYGLYRDRAINQTVFWGVKFSQGSSFILTSLSTVGALGFGALIIFLAAFIWQALRIFGKKKNGREDEIIRTRSLRSQNLDSSLHSELRTRSLRSQNLDSSLHSEFGAEDFNIPLIAAALFSLIAWFVYPANFALMMLGFICLGLMMAGWKAGKGGAREISLLTSPQRTLIISLILIILMIGSVAVLYLEGQKYIASLYFSSGLNAFNRTGDPDIALDKFVKAINLDASVDQYWRAASQAFLIKTSNILNSPAWQGAAAAALEDLRSQFQVNMSQAISFAQRATEADSKESINWTNLGYIYENILLFVNGAEKFLADSYSKAISLEPKNPALRVDFGRAHIAVADRLAAQINQISNSQSPDKAQIETLTAQYKEELTTATKELEKAVVLKPDYSPAHFLLVQASTREGDLKKALAKSIDYFNLNQKDPGAAFQLGFLYYKDNQMDSAKAALEWAVALNESYSNARYFLGLIYDAQGNKQAAKEQFKRIAALNPDNQEVKKILENLNAGRVALETIVPPAPAPEQRTQTPVPETGGAEQQSLQQP